MKAMRFDRYGPPSEVLRLRDVDVPDVGNDGILVRVRAAGLNPADWHMVSGVPHVARAELGLRRPRASGLGADLAGSVEAVGRDVTSVRVGDEVYGGVDLIAGTRVFDLGSVAELVRVTDGSVVRAPSSLTAVEAAAVPLAATTALQGLRDVADVRPGQNVLVHGASGGVGTFAVQIARVLGAGVTGVCSTRNVDLVASLGADAVVDYTRDDPTRIGRRFDVVLDNVGDRPINAWRRVLKRDGTYVGSYGMKEHRHVGPMLRMLRMAALGLVVPQRLASLPMRFRATDLTTLAELIEEGRLRPVVDRTYPLVAAAEALDYLGDGHARGKVVVTVQEG